MIAKKGEEHYKNGTQYAKYTLLGESDADEIDLYYMESGEIMITPGSANTVTTGAITFANEFNSAPNVIVTAKTTVPQNITCGVSDVTTTGANIYMTRTNTTNTYFQWLAIGKKKA